MKFMPIGELRKSQKQLMELLENPPSEFNAAAIAELGEVIADVEVQIQERTAGEPEVAEDSDKHALPCVDPPAHADCHRRIHEKA